MKLKEQERLDLIERMIDESSLQEFLEDVAEVCFLKKEHVLSNWQDYYTAKYWDKQGLRIQRLARY